MHRQQRRRPQVLIQAPKCVTGVGAFVASLHVLFNKPATVLSERAPDKTGELRPDLSTGGFESTIRTLNNEMLLQVGAAERPTCTQRRDG